MASFRMSRQVEGQLKHTPGVIAYSLAVDPRRRHFWTYSLWASRDAMLAFSHAEPHAIASGRYDEWADEGSAFVEWHTDSKDLDWNEAFERLKQPTFTRKPA
jgi:quinol monooxygenase YgiN